MSYLQILDCNQTLANCCSDYGIVNILSILKTILDLVQLFVPIILIIALAIQFTKMMINPDDKKSPKKLLNMFLSAVFCFFLPIIVDVVLGLLDGYSLGACWQTATTTKRLLDFNSQSAYRTTSSKTTTSILTDFNGYDPGNEPASGNGSAMGSAIVTYAKSFVGQKYVYGGSWNGEVPYTGTDCSGFVQGVFKHFGFKLTRTTSSQWNDTSTYTLVNPNDIRAGDIINYAGHTGILTGNGKEVIHAKGIRYGIVIDPDYTKCSSHAINGIMRIKGVN